MDASIGIHHPSQPKGKKHIHFNKSYLEIAHRSTVIKPHLICISFSQILAFRRKNIPTETNFFIYTFSSLCFFFLFKEIYYLLTILTKPTASQLVFTPPSFKYFLFAPAKRNFIFVLYRQTCYFLLSC